MQTSDKLSRTNSARQGLLDFFVDSNEPADFQQISDWLANHGIEVNKTTIYRQLDRLVVLGQIEEIDLGEGKKRYEAIKGHHHHLYCTECNHVECFELEENIADQEREISRRTKFKIQRHILDFFGLCEKCQKK